MFADRPISPTGASLFVGSRIQDEFDFEFYLHANRDVAQAGMDPLDHYNRFGWREGRDPNAYFDAIAYLAAYRDV
ncbi:hypothetical protein [Microvirga massiliensis]|uniref:hypothetical protein n=1 Tax=Microvirga massiliensis TaxID=1033741 RepID=UPI0007C7AF2B|nr:hypothetical protein [Microvirga massiliensis]